MWSSRVPDLTMFWPRQRQRRRARVSDERAVRAVLYPTRVRQVHAVLRERPR